LRLTFRQYKLSARPDNLIYNDQDSANVEALKDFDWASTEPLKFRPFKPIYHITMGKPLSNIFVGHHTVPPTNEFFRILGVHSTPPSDLITIDSNYLSRINIRKQTMTDHPTHTLGCIPSGVDVVQEVYTYLLQDYLPTRYPSLFSRDEKNFHNHVTNAYMPLSPPDDPIHALRLLGETVEDDMFLLQSCPEGHRSVAFLCTSPSGFDPSAKLGRLLEDIHKPVPSYEKIGPSMERYFSRLEVGKNATRVNVSTKSRNRRLCAFENSGSQSHANNDAVVGDYLS
jgi:hypothetical protein